MRRSRSVAFWLSLCIVFFLVLPVLTFAQRSDAQSLITQAVDETKLTLLKGNTHPLARPEFDRGPAPLTLPMERMLLVLTRSPEQEAALQRLLEEQQDKSSPNYHKWLTPEQFGRQFGASDQDIQTITAWLRSHGFQIANVSKGRTVVEFSGTAAQVQEAFHTSIHKYAVNGEEHWANANDPQIPTALTPVAVGVDSLHNFPKKSMSHLAGLFSREKATGKVKAIRPEFTFPGGCDQDGNCYALGPYDFATIYNVLPLWNGTPAIDGAGQTIAIVGRSNINIQDVRDFRNLFGLPANDPQIILDGPDPGITGDETEADLNVQWSGAVAKGATIKFVVSASTDTTDGVDLSAVYIVDNNVAPVMSESFGACELFFGTAGNQFINRIWQQAAAQGITVFVSSGDNGSAGCDFPVGPPPQPAMLGLQVSGTASTPYNVAVGGTDFNDFFNPSTYWNASNSSTTQASAKGYIPETTWNDTCTNAILASLGFSNNAETNCNNPQLAGLVTTIGGSGGKSSCTTSNGQSVSSCSGGYAKPSWQTGTGVPSDGKRDIPDVSLFASAGFVGNFYIICEADLNPGGQSCNLNFPFTNFVGVGGTSASSPAFAGIMALVNQKTQLRQGNANFVFYKLAAQQPASSCNSSSNPATTCVFNDVTSGTIATPCATGTPNCTTSNSGDKYGVLSGYSTTTGYDLATGLGSVNANNLVNDWTSVTFKPTTSTLSINPMTNITHGTAVNVNITVAPTTGTGTPGGQVSLLTSNSQGVTNFTLSNGAVSSTTNVLPGGSYTVTAHYAGDGTFGASDSTPAVAVTVSPEASTTAVKVETLNQNGNFIPFSSGPYGSFVYLRADIAGQSGNGFATGSVNFTDRLNGSTSNVTGDPYALNSEGNTVTPIGLFTFATGAHSMAASYSGDASFNPSSTTSPANFTITQAATNTVLCCSVPSTFGSAVSFNATVSTNVGLNPLTGTYNGASTPAGTVTLFSGTTQIGSPFPVSGSVAANQTAQATASFTTTQLPLGQDTVTVQYSGDTNYSASPSVPFNISVTIPTTTTVATSNPTVVQGLNVTFTAQVAPNQNGGPAPTGTVQFIVDSVYTGSPVSVSSAPIQFMTSFPTPGVHEVQAMYSGDVNYQTSLGGFAETVTAAFTISASPTTINVANPGASGQTALTITAQGGFAGTVGFTCSGLPFKSSCSFNPTSITGSGTTTVTISTTAPSMLVPSHPKAYSRWTPTDWLTLVYVLYIAALLPTFRRTERRWSTVFGLTLFALLLAFAACGGGGGGSAGAPAVSLSPTSLSFGTQIQGTESAPMTTTLTNNGDALLSISNITVTGANNGDFAQVNTCASSVAAGSNCTIAVMFLPSTASSESASVSVADNAAGSPQTVSLSGTGQIPGTPTGTFSVIITAAGGNINNSTTITLNVQ